jgi:hypothetical protein
MQSSCSLLVRIVSFHLLSSGPVMPGAGIYQTHRLKKVRPPPDPLGNPQDQEKSIRDTRGIKRNEGLHKDTPGEHIQCRNYRDAVTTHRYTAGCSRSNSTVGLTVSIPGLRAISIRSGYFFTFLASTLCFSETRVVVIIPCFLSEFFSEGPWLQNIPINGSLSGRRHQGGYDARARVQCPDPYSFNPSCLIQ